MAQFKIFNGPTPTSAGLAKVATGTAIKTLLQVKPSATAVMKLLEWGISMDASAAAIPVLCECLEVDVAATVTAFVAADINKWDGAALMCGDPTTNMIQVGTSASGYTATAEGTVTASRVFDTELVGPTNQYIYQFPGGREPIIQVAKFARVRVTAPATVNALCWMLVEV